MLQAKTRKDVSALLQTCLHPFISILHKHSVGVGEHEEKYTIHLCICLQTMTRVFKPLHISVPNASFCSNSLHHPFVLRVEPTSLLHAFNSRLILGQQAANSSSIFSRIYYHFHVTRHRFTFSTTTAFDKLTSAFCFPTFLLIWFELDEVSSLNTSHWVCMQWWTNV